MDERTPRISRIKEMTFTDREKVIFMYVYCIMPLVKQMKKANCSENEICERLMSQVVKERNLSLSEIEFLQILVEASDEYSSLVYYSNNLADKLKSLINTIKNSKNAEKYR